MKNTWWRVLTVSVLVAAAVAFFVWQRRQVAYRRWDATSSATPYEEMSEFSAIESEREVVIHCGNSMRLAMEQIANEFQKRHGIAVIFNFGGSSELLPLIEMGRRGDLYVCHDPYAEILRDKGLLEQYSVIGMLEPVVMVPHGNPHSINGLADLGRDGLRVATVDPRYATAGKMLEAVLAREEWGRAVKDNIVVESRGHSDAAMALLTGHVDAAVVWSFIAALYAGRLEMVDPGVEFPEEIRVTLVRLVTAQNHEEARAFTEFLQSDVAQKVLAHYGYVESK